MSKHDARKELAELLYEAYKGKPPFYWEQLSLEEKLKWRRVASGAGKLTHTDLSEERDEAVRLMIQLKASAATLLEEGKKWFDRHNEEMAKNLKLELRIVELEREVNSLRKKDRLCE